MEAAATGISDFRRSDFADHLGIVCFSLQCGTDDDESHSANA